MDHVYDVAIIGGGINGCGSAADAAMRGLSVLLCEQDDLASKTSSNSSKLIHGGLRYLEYYDFALVKKALDEQQVLLQLAPHLVHPLAFVLPHKKDNRPRWLLRAGLFIYDHLSRTNTLPNSTAIHRHQPAAYFSPLTHDLNQGFLFYDCKTDDARLTLANAMQAREHGATILTQTTLTQAETHANQWHLTLQPKSGASFQVRAKAVINAAGPWVETVSQLLRTPLHHTLSLVKGSHIIVPKLYEGEHAYLLQHNDQRIVFVIPYHGYTMVGTTDVAFTEPLDNIHIDAAEIDYLGAVIDRYFNQRFNKNAIISSWSGIRPLLSAAGKNPSALSRDYAYHYSNHPAPAVTIYGGKITTYRQLALQVVNQLQAVCPKLPPSRSHDAPLPGSTLGSMDYARYQHYAREKYTWLDKATLERYFESYGTYTEKILQGCHQRSDLGPCFTPTLYQVEVDYLIRDEWATTVDDIVWRRSKLGLTINVDSYTALIDYVSNVRATIVET